MALTTFVAGNVLTAAQLNDSFAAVGGLRAVVPTSVTVTGGGSSGSVGTNGKVTFGTAASVSVNGCFSAGFTNYRIVMDYDAGTAGGNLDLRWRVGGTDNTTANSYSAQLFQANSTTIAGVRVTGSSLRIGAQQTTFTNAISMDVYRPFAADSTGVTVFNLDSSNNSYLSIAVGTHNQDVSYDGFTLIPAAGTISGSVTIYGYFG